MTSRVLYKDIYLRIRRRNKSIEREIKDAVRVRNRVRRDSILLTFPTDVKMVCVKNIPKSLCILYIYDKLYSFIFTITLNKIFYIKYYNDTNSLKVQFNARYLLIELGFSHLYKMLHMFYGMFTKRLRVRGRLYRIYKRNIYRDLHYRFGHTHYMTVYTEGMYVKFIRKKKIRIFGYDYALVSEKAKEAKNVFPLNIYTNKGIRLGGERIYSKVGKAVKWY